MGRSLDYVPCLYNYADALRHYNQTKPIRGQGERRPLGRRRDHNAFWMRKDEPTGSFECMYYRTPVVTFHPDNTVTIRNGGYASSTTHGFITEILGRVGVQANTWMGKTRLMVNGQIHIMEKDKPVKLVMGADGRLHLTDVKELNGYAMNRKAANNVRRKYKEFADYFVGMVKLRTQVMIPELYRNFPNPSHYEKRIVRATAQEFIDAVGTTIDKDYGRPGVYTLATKFDYLNVAYGRQKWYDAKAVKYRPGQEAAFLSFINPSQPEETKMANYYKAALLLLLGDRGMNFTPDKLVNNETIVDMNSDEAVAFYDRSLLMAHAKEVLTLTKLAPGKMPNTKYIGWILNEEK